MYDCAAQWYDSASACVNHGVNTNIACDVFRTLMKYFKFISKWSEVKKVRSSVCGGGVEVTGPLAKKHTNSNSSR